MTHIGVTGHQRLEDPAAWPWVEEAVGRELDAASKPLVVVTSLAIGADQLVARLGISRSAAVHAVLPFAGIERTFAAEDLPEYRRLASQASVEILRTPGTDEDAYLAAGRRVVELSPGAEQSRIASAIIATGLTVGWRANRLPSLPDFDNVFTPG